MPRKRPSASDSDDEESDPTFRLWPRQRRQSSTEEGRRRRSQSRTLTVNRTENSDHEETNPTYRRQSRRSREPSVNGNRQQQRQRSISRAENIDIDESTSQRYNLRSRRSREPSIKRNTEQPRNQLTSSVTKSTDEEMTEMFQKQSLTDRSTKSVQKNQSKRSISRDTDKGQEKRSRSVRGTSIEHDERALGSHVRNEDADMELSNTEQEYKMKLRTRTSAIRYTDDEQMEETNDRNERNDPDYLTSKEINRRTNYERRRVIRECRHTATQLSDSEDDKDEIAEPPAQFSVCSLGEMNDICPYCAAIHFSGGHVCCQMGKIFLPPLRRLPPEIYSRLFGTAEQPYSKEFLENIIRYNTCFSVASIQRQKVPANPFGLPVEKTLGLHKHFSSTVLPANPNDPKFGNYYVYLGKEAVDWRMRGAEAVGGLNRQTVQDLQACFERCYPFAEFYQTMGQIMEEMRKDPDQDEDILRMRIVDARKVPKDFLQGNHPGIYRESMQRGDHVALFFTANTEQDVKLPGLNIYPRRNNSIPMPIFPDDPRINSFCYPILFPYGETGWKWFGIKHWEDPNMPYIERLKKFAEENPSITKEWEVEIPAEELIQHSMEIENELNPQFQQDEAENEDSDLEEHRLHEEQCLEETHQQREIEFEERGGEFYPRFATDRPQQRKIIQPVQDNDEEMMDVDENIMRGVGLVEHSGDLLETDLDDIIISDDLLDALELEEYPMAEDDNMQIDHPTVISETADLTASHSSEHEQPVQVGEINQAHQDETKYVSLREHWLYMYQHRYSLNGRHRGAKQALIKNRFSAAGKLGQLFLLDQCTHLYEQRSSISRGYHTEYMNSDRKKFLTALQNKANKHNRKIGCVSSIPHTVPGSPRYLHKLFEKTVAMARMRKGKPDLFITATANINWPEIKDNLLPGETWADRPFLVNEVFIKKFIQLLEMIIGEKYEKHRAERKPGIFGRVRWWAYSIEFQQRGPPHAHLLVSLKKHINTAEQIDRVCQAVLPKVVDRKDQNAQDTILRKLVEQLMVHRPCENDPKAYCKANAKPYWEKCRKHFPHEFTETTRFGDRNYPEYRRPNDGEAVWKDKGVKADNRHVVAYNPQLLYFFQAHCNVEVVSNIRVVKYIFKYIFKGYDRVLVEAITTISAPETADFTIDGNLIIPRKVKLPQGVIKQRQMLAVQRLKKMNVNPIDENGKEVLVYDEYSMVEDQRAITSCEAAWEHAGYKRHAESHDVITLCVHQEEHEPIRYKPEEQEKMAEQLLANPDIKTRLKGWFNLNQKDPEARKLTYDQLPTKYRFDKGEWIKKKNVKENLFGVVKSVHPRNEELFAIRLLSTVQKGPCNFKELRTVNGFPHNTFTKAAKALGLMNDQDEWNKVLEEAEASAQPVTLRRLFASILVFNTVIDPLKLWKDHLKHLVERKDTWNEETKIAHALNHIESFLNAHLATLKDYNLPSVNTSALPPKCERINDYEEMAISTEEAKKMANSLVPTLNEEQQDVFNKIKMSIEDPNHRKGFFIQGSGGTGKTRLLTTLYYSLLAEGKNVMCVAHTGVAAQLLPFGSTAHRALYIPLTVEENMRCNVALESNTAEMLKKVDVVLWDEATMSDRRILNAVHLLMAGLHPETDLLFGGVKFVFCGDWKQTLPIVPNVRGSAVLNYTMLRSKLWKQVEILRLKNNMRARFDQPYCQWLEMMGMGLLNINPKARAEDQLASLDFGTHVDSEGDLIKAVLGGGKTPEEQIEIFKTSAILAVDNQTTFDINNRALNLIKGEDEITFYSVDQHAENRGFSFLDPEVYHGQTLSGMPQHELKLKKGAPVILLRNINTRLGLVNGTRMIVDEIKKHVIWVIPVGDNKYLPKRWPLHRMMFTPTNVLSREQCFVRTQFPIRLGFSVTCNKAQGQTLERVGILLRTPCFSHGQLYVALSRVRRSTDLYIYNANGINEKDPKKKLRRRKETNNVVYSEAVHWLLPKKN